MFTCIELIYCDCAQAGLLVYIVALLLFSAICLESRPVLVEGFANNVHVPDGKLMVGLAGTTDGPVLDPLSNSLPSGLSPNGLWEPGPVLKYDEISQGYSEQFSLKFLSQCQVV